MKIIPAIDIQNGNCVRLKQGDFQKETIFHSSPLDMAQKWVSDGAERLHLVDLDGARLGGPINIDVVSSICKKFPNIPKLWSKKKDPRFPGGENLNDVLVRLNKFKMKLKKKFSSLQNKKILIVTHNVFLRCLIGECFNIPKYNWYKINLLYGQEFNFIFSRGKLLPNINRNLFSKIKQYQ